MINSIEKAKIPFQYGYVLKTGQLENLLQDNNIDIHVDLRYWFAQNIGSILDAHYWLPNENIEYFRLYIRAGALLKQDIFIARKKMEEIVLPEFVSWVKNILVLPDNSPSLKHNLYFNADFCNGDVYINK